MTTINAEEAASRPITTDDEIEQRAADLVGSACRRQLWLFFLDDGDIQLPLLMPLEDYPPGPGEGAAASIAGQVAELMEHVGAAKLVVVWERRLGEASTPGDRRWSAALAREFAERGVPLRAQVLSHRRGVRMLTPAECAGERAETAS